MAYTIMKNGDFTQPNVLTFIVDTLNEIKDLPTNIGVGSSAEVLEDSSTWKLGNDHQWYEFITQSGGGGTRGANCMIKSIVKQNGQNIVTFQWKDEDNKTRESVMIVDDGTPIYDWKAGDSYKVGDLAIYNNTYFYRCITANSDLVFDPSKWASIGGSSDSSDYSIVQTESQLPTGYSSTDRKMCYVIEKDCFYLWNGTSWNAEKTTAIDGESITVDENGNLTVNTTTSDDINSLFNNP